MSTHTERFFSRKSSGRYGQGIRLNQVNFMDPSLGRGWRVARSVSPAHLAVSAPGSRRPAQLERRAFRTPPGAEDVGGNGPERSQESQVFLEITRPRSAEPPPRGHIGRRRGKPAVQRDSISRVA